MKVIVCVFVENVNEISDTYVFNDKNRKSRGVPGLRKM
jgi:hypothetical protein